MSTYVHAQVKQPLSQASSFMPAIKGLVQRKCSDHDCSKKKLTLQRYSIDNTEPSTVPPIVHEVLRSPGQTLDSDSRTYMEPRFGHDFSMVRIHTDAKAAESARAVNARAYTVGRDVVLRGYASGTIEGQRLIAHELAHMVQQHSQDYGVLNSFRLNPPGDLAEREAIKNANIVIGGGSLQVTREIRPDIVMCKPETTEEESPGILATIGGGMVGEFNEDPTYAMIGVDMGVSLIPILDQISDARDISAHIYYMTAYEQYKNPGRWVSLVFTLVGLVPEIGSVIKSISKSAIKGIGELISRLEEILKLANKVFPEITDINRLQKYIAENWDRIVTMGKKNWGFALNKASYWANIASKFIGERGQKIKEALAMIKEIAPQKLDEAFVWVKRQIDNILEQVREHLGHKEAKIEESKAISKPKIETSKQPFVEQDIDEMVEKGIFDDELNLTFTRLEEGKIPQEGELTKWQPHAEASRNREALGMKGSDIQSTHGAPQSAMRNFPGYDPDAAITQLMPRGSHTGMDRYWKTYARAQKSKGHKTWTAREMFDVVSESIKRTPGMSKTEQFTLIQRLYDELFLEYGLKDTDLLRLPWSK